MSAYFTDAELDALMVAADLLMPADGQLPSVAESGLREQHLDEAIAARPDLETCLHEFAVQAADHGVDATVSTCRARRPEIWDAITTALPGGYFLSPAVRAALGYRGQTPQLIVLEGRPDYEEFISVVIQRGPAFRPTP